MYIINITLHVLTFHDENICTWYFALVLFSAINIFMKHNKLWFLCKEQKQKVSENHKRRWKHETTFSVLFITIRLLHDCIEH